VARFEISTQIDRPVSEVWDYFTDLTNSPQWTRSGSELRLTTPGPIVVGSTAESVRSVFGRQIKSQALVATTVERNHLLAYTSDLPLLGRILGGATFETVGTSTLMSRWSESQAGGLRGALIRLLTPLLLRAQRTEMANLKRLIEARA
jgi:uncharacterized protein YndB with AHSA1/START domain